MQVSLQESVVNGGFGFYGLFADFIILPVLGSTAKDTLANSPARLTSSNVASSSDVNLNMSISAN